MRLISALSNDLGMMVAISCGTLIAIGGRRPEGDPRVERILEDV
jgi:hypothetical protein